MKILITGATGLIGRKLATQLFLAGHEISIVSRTKAAEGPFAFPCKVFQGDLTKGPIDSLKTEQFDAVFHLMGETVAQRWTEETKRKILDSRVLSSQYLLESISQVGTLITASAIGIYGDQGEEILDETSPLGSDFLAEVCKSWELAFASKASLSKVKRSVHLRIGVVLAENGGAIDKMLLPYQLGAGGPIAGGKHWMSWIHIEDLINMFEFVLNNSNLQGAINATSPNPVRNSEFSKALASALGKPNFLPTPAMALKLAMGEMANIVLASTRVVPNVLLKSGFKFHFAEVNEALNHLLGHLGRGESKVCYEQFVTGKSLPEIFDFFSSEKNLERITPQSLSFKVLSKSTAEIQAGTMIKYKLKIHGVPVGWLTQIQNWNPPHQFVDVQLQGPYALWHHTHDFFPTANGVLLRDTVRYKEPLGLLGKLTAGFLVRKDVESIFSFRKKILAEIFR